MWRTTVYVKYIFALKQDCKENTVPRSIVKSLGKGINENFKLKILI